MSISKNRIKKLEETIKERRPKKFPIPIMSFVRGHIKKQDMEQYETARLIPMGCLIHPHKESDYYETGEYKLDL